MSEPPPFILLPLRDGRVELRAFSDDSDDPIVLPLDQADGRAFGLAVAEVLSSLDSTRDAVEPVALVIAGRRVTVHGTVTGGIAIDVERE